MNDNFLNISKPEIYKDKWLKFNDAVLYPMELCDCNDTIGGVCLSGLTFEECVDKCKGDCDIGYYIEFDSNKNICVPIRSEVYSDINPSFNLRNKDIYNFNDNVKITYFQNTEKYPFQKPSTMELYYTDVVSIVSYYNPKIALNLKSLKSDEYAYMSEIETFENISILPNISTNSKLLDWLPINYGNYLTLNIPNSNLILRNTLDNVLNFQTISFDDSIGKDKVFNNDIIFYLEPLDKNNKNKIVRFGEPFVIKTTNKGVVFNDGSMLKVTYEPIDKMSKEQIYFTFTPKMSYYYCDSSICKTVSYDNIIFQEGSKSLQTKNSNGELTDVYFKPNCSQMCDVNKLQNVKTLSSNKQKKSMIFGIIIIIVIIIMIMIFVYIRVKHRV